MLARAAGLVACVPGASAGRCGVRAGSLSQLRSCASSSSGSRPTPKRSALAQAYLREYAEARDKGDLDEALRFLEKATQAARHVHVWTHQANGKDQCVPLSAIVPSTFCGWLRPVKHVLPVSVDSRPDVESSTSLQLPNSQAGCFLPLRELKASLQSHNCPMPIVVPMDPGRRR